MEIRKLVKRILPYFALSIAILFMVLFWDAGSNAKYHARDTACKSNLKRIGEEIELYRRSHNGEMPSNFIQLKYRYNSLFLCPLVSSEKKPDGKYTNYTYFYRKLKSPNATDIICWDRKPHIPQHEIFVSENTPRRNILLVNGTVKTIDEKEFQSLHLTGTVGELTAYTRKWVKSG